MIIGTALLARSPTGMSRRFLLTALLLLTASSALAQLGVGISPPRVEFQVQPGAQLTQTIIVDNPAQSDAVTVNAYFNDAYQMPDGSVFYATPGSSNRSLAPWTTATPLAFTLQPAAKTETRYTISVPADAQPGTYWTVLFFETEQLTAAGNDAGVGVTTVVRVAHLVYVTVGQPLLDGRITGMHYGNEDGADELRVTFQNSGNGLLRLNGRAEVRNTGGELLQTVLVQDQASLPEALHDLVLPLPEPLPAGEYVVLAALDYGEGSVITGEGRITVP